MELCKACLSTGKSLIIMDDTFVNNFNILTSLNITLTDDVSFYTCKKCFDGAKFCIEFRNKCIASDQTLKELLLQKTKKSSSPKENIDEIVIAVKEEVKLEYDNSSYSCLKYDDEEVYLEFSTISEKKNTKSIKSLLKTETEVKHDEDYFVDYSNISKKYDKNLKLLATNKRTRKNKSTINKKKKTQQDEIFCKIKIDKENVVDSKILCRICPENLKDKKDLTKHLDNHKLNVPCGLCGESFVTMPHLLAHRIDHLPDKQKRCHICSKKFLTAPSLEFHYMRIHELAEKDVPIYCKKCPASFESGQKLHRHTSFFHSEIKFKCDHCTLGFGKKEMLQVHMRKHGLTKCYKCDLCNYSTVHSSGINAHKLRKHTEGITYCKVCCRVFSSKSLLEQHICKDSLGVVCPVCGKFLKSRSGSGALKRHLITHENVYRYKCDQCPAKFKARDNYRTHMDQHAGTPKHQCEYCKRLFYSKTVLVKHRRTHTGEKPYVCTICKRGFTGNHNLKVHMRVHGIMNLINKKDSAE